MEPSSILKKIDLREITEEVIAKFKRYPLAVSLEFITPVPGVYTTMADKAKISAGIRRLIENGIKYTEKGTVTVSLEKKSDVIRILVIDTSIDISKNDLTNIFKEFHRADNARNMSSVGTGLGLYITKKDIESHYGKICAESDGVNKGSRFFLELPL